MQLIKLDATDSTNAHLKRICKGENLPDFTVVQARYQTAGKGQPGTYWEAEKGKNLTFSVLKWFKSLPARRHFMLNACISLSVYRALSALEIPGLSLKWPNDIMSGSHKICGILIENQIQGDLITRGIIGIGLNINQIRFPNLPGASSLKRLTGREYDPDEVLMVVMKELKSGLASMDGPDFEDILREYNTRLYLRNSGAVYRRKDGTAFKGVIRGVDREGMLQIEGADGALESFGFKEVRYPGARA